MRIHSDETRGQNENHVASSRMSHASHKSGCSLFNILVNMNVLHKATIPERVRRIQYEVRGSLVMRAHALQRQIQQNPSCDLPFSRVLFCNIGNPQQLGQLPISFFRQVLALVEYPKLMDFPESKNLFPSDAIERAKRFLSAGSIGEQ